MAYVAKRKQPKKSLDVLWTSKNVTIADGKASNFGSVRFLRLPYTFLPQNNPYEMQWVFKTGTNFSTPGYIFSLGTSTYTGVGVWVHTDKSLRIAISDGGTGWQVAGYTLAILADNTEYTLKVEYTSTEYKCYLNGELKYTYTFSVGINNILNFNIGANRIETEPFIGQYIDLNKCYIKINNELWWTPYSDKSANYNKIGLPKITKEGTISDFSASNYIEIPKLFDVSKQEKWEWVLKVHTGTFIDNEYQVLLRGKVEYTSFILQMLGNKFAVFASSNGTSMDIASKYMSTLTLNDNTDYWIKTSFNGSQYLVDVSTDNKVWTNYITIVSSLSVYKGFLIMGVNTPAFAIRAPWKGSIDLNESYIKVEEGLWWSWRKQEYKEESYVAKRKVKELRPNIKRINAPDINDDFIITKTDMNDLVKLPSTIKFDNNPWEIQFKIKYAISTHSQALFHSVSNVNTGGVNDGLKSSYGLALLLSTDNKLMLYVASIDTSWNISDGVKGSTTLNAGYTYYIKIAFTGSAYRVYLSTSKIFDNIEISVNSNAVVPERHYTIGGTNDPNNQFVGQTDLKECYIKINDEEHWKGVALFDAEESYVAKRKVAKYFKYLYEDWTQPVLTSSGTLGGDRFAVWSRKHPQDTWKAFDADRSTEVFEADYMPNDLVFYNPEPLLVTKIYAYRHDNGYHMIGTFEGSDDNHKYIKLADINWPNGAAEPVSFDVTSTANRAFKYHRFHITATYSNDMAFRTINIIAKKQVAVEVSAKEYAPVTQGFTSYIGSIVANMPVVTQVGTSDLYKVYWERLKGEDGTYTEPAYTSYIYKTEFESLAKEDLITQYRGDGSIYPNPKPMYKTGTYLTNGSSYRIGSPDVFKVEQEL